MNDPIRCESLTKIFRRNVALNQVNLLVPPNSIFTLLGPNGAGKTTLIKILLNLQRPSSGSAQILDRDSRRLSRQQLMRIGYVSENQELPEWMTVAYLLRYLKPFYPTWDDALALDLVRQFNLPLDRKLGNLSRGMRVKAALAASLAYQPEVIILDEPFSGLDPLVRDEVIQGLLERASAASVLISSHDLSEIESFASHIGYLESGNLQFSEHMATLTGRFREVEVILDNPVLPVPCPPSWLMPELSPSLLRFVESRFDPENTPVELTHLFPGARNLSFRPMPLRQIFVALARTARKAA